MGFDIWGFKYLRLVFGIFRLVLYMLIEVVGRVLGGWEMLEVLYKCGWNICFKL